MAINVTLVSLTYYTDKGTLYQFKDEAALEEALKSLKPDIVKYEFVDYDSEFHLPPVAFDLENFKKDKHDFTRVKKLNFQDFHQKGSIVVYKNAKDERESALLIAKELDIAVANKDYYVYSEAWDTFAYYSNMLMFLNDKSIKTNGFTKESIQNLIDTQIS